MSCGVYALYWEEQDLVYVGISNDIDRRCTAHFNMLKSNRHTNYKVQNAYSLYGYPKFILLELCSYTELHIKEISWCIEFDALGPNGLNIAAPGISGWGVNHSQSKYSRKTILKVFSLLYQGYKSVFIQKRLKVPKSLVSDIYLGRTHKYIEQEFPEKYYIMQNIDRKKILYDTEVRGTLLDKDTGVVHTITNIHQFCRNITYKKVYPTHILSVLVGRRKSHKGFIKV